MTRILTLKFEGQTSDTLSKMAKKLKTTDVGVIREALSTLEEKLYPVQKEK